MEVVDVRYFAGSLLVPSWPLFVDSFSCSGLLLGPSRGDFGLGRVHA